MKLFLSILYVWNVLLLLTNQKYFFSIFGRYLGIQIHIEEGFKSLIQLLCSLKDRKKRRRSKKKVLRNAETGQEVDCDKDNDVIGDNVDEDAENINDHFAMTAGGGGNMLRHVRIWSRCMMDLVRKLNNFHQPGNSIALFH